MRIVFSSFIEADLVAIADFIARDNPIRAVTFIQEMRERIRAIGANPFLYRLRPELGESARMATMGNYVILFQILDDWIRIERVVYGGRDLDALLNAD